MTLACLPTRVRQRTPSFVSRVGGARIALLHSALSVRISKEKQDEHVGQSIGFDQNLWVWGGRDRDVCCHTAAPRAHTPAFWSPHLADYNFVLVAHSDVSTLNLYAAAASGCEQGSEDESCLGVWINKHLPSGDGPSPSCQTKVGVGSHGGLRPEAAHTAATPC